VVSKVSIQRWYPNLVSKGGIQMWYPKVVSKGGIQSWYPKPLEFVKFKANSSSKPKSYQYKLLRRDLCSTLHPENLATCNFVSHYCLLEYDAVRFVREVPRFGETCCLHLHSSSTLQTEKHVTSKRWHLSTKQHGVTS
jgi:hypothetical protein